MQTNPKKANKKLPNPPLGWPLLSVPRNGTLSYPSLNESIKQYIKILFLTRKGELLMRPQFGAGLVEFVHQPNVLETRYRIQQSIQQELEIWEQRIEVNRVDLWEEDRPDRVRIEIDYRIKRSGEIAQTNITMKLGS